MLKAWSPKTDSLSLKAARSEIGLKVMRAANAIIPPALIYMAVFAAMIAATAPAVAADYFTDNSLDAYLLRDAYTGGDR